MQTGPLQVQCNLLSSSVRNSLAVVLFPSPTAVDALTWISYKLYFSEKNIESHILLRSLLKLKCLKDTRHFSQFKLRRVLTTKISYVFELMRVKISNFIFRWQLTWLMNRNSYVTSSTVTTSFYEPEWRFHTKSVRM